LLKKGPTAAIADRADRRPKPMQNTMKQINQKRAQIRKYQLSFRKEEIQ
jgi:hypothetical protein